VVGPVGGGDTPEAAFFGSEFVPPGGHRLGAGQQTNHRVVRDAQSHDPICKGSRAGGDITAPASASVAQELVANPSRLLARRCSNGHALARMNTTTSCAGEES